MEAPPWPWALELDRVDCINCEGVVDDLVDSSSESSHQNFLQANNPPMNWTKWCKKRVIIRKVKKMR